MTYDDRIPCAHCRQPVWYCGRPKRYRNEDWTVHYCADLIAPVVSPPESEWRKMIQIQPPPRLPRLKLPL